MVSRKSVPVVPAETPVTSSRITPRLLRIADAADYMSCTFGFVEALMRERTIPVVVLGKRHLFDIRDLDAYIERLKETAA
jgi:excisionase family DNA binding protein